MKSKMPRFKTRIDLVNQKYEINDWSKTHHVNHPNPPYYSLANDGPSNPQAEGPPNEYSYEPQKPESNKSRFEPIFIIGGLSIN